MLARVLHCPVIQRNLRARIDLINSSSEISVHKRQLAVVSCVGSAVFMQ